MSAKDAEGRTVARPTLVDVMAFDLQVRKSVMRLFNAGKDLAAALREAVADPSLRTRFLITPLAISGPLQSVVAARTTPPPLPRAVSSAAAAPPLPPPPPGLVVKGASSKKRGSRAGKGGSNKTVHSKTPDGRNICFAWNKDERSCPGTCKFVHVCRMCFGNHTMHACPMRGEFGPPAKRGKGGDGSASAGPFQ